RPATEVFAPAAGRRLSAEPGAVLRGAANGQAPDPEPSPPRRLGDAGLHCAGAEPESGCTPPGGATGLGLAGPSGRSGGTNPSRQQPVWVRELFLELERRQTARSEE